MDPGNFLGSCHWSEKGALDADQCSKRELSGKLCDVLLAKFDFRIELMKWAVEVGVQGRAVIAKDPGDHGRLGNLPCSIGILVVADGYAVFLWLADFFSTIS